MVGSSQFTTVTVSQRYIYKSFCIYTHLQHTGPHQITTPKNAPWVPDKSVHIVQSQGFLAAREVARSCHTLGSLREPGFLCQADQRRKTQPSPQRGQASATFPGSAQNINRAKGEEEFTVHSSTQGHVPALGALKRQKGFLLAASSPLKMA